MEFGIELRITFLHGNGVEGIPTFDLFFWIQHGNCTAWHGNWKLFGWTLD